MTKKARNPNMRIGGKKPKTAPKVVRAPKSTFLVLTIQNELREARWQRTNAYNVGRLPTRFIQGKEVSGGFRNSCDDDIRRLYCDMWVRSLHKLHKLILGLAPDPDDTEREFPLKGV